MPPDLTDEQVYDLLFNARRALGDDEAMTVRGRTVLEFARQSLVTLQFGLLQAMDAASDRIEPLSGFDEPPQPPSPLPRSR